MHLNVLLFYFSFFFFSLFVHAVINSFYLPGHRQKDPESEATEKYV